MKPAILGLKRSPPIEKAFSEKSRKSSNLHFFLKISKVYEGNIALQAFFILQKKVGFYGPWPSEKNT